MNKVFLVLLSFAVLGTNGLPKREPQTVGVRGKLLCNQAPAENIKVKLYDTDTFTLDDLMGEAQTDRTGEFHVHGTANEFTNIDPKVNIYHHCGDTGGLLQKCAKKFSITIPKNYIAHNSHTVQKYFDVGTLNLNGHFSGEGRDCIH